MLILSKTVCFRWLSYVISLGVLLTLGYSGDVAVSIPGCESCPDRCLLGDGSKGKCVPCIKDVHCQGKSSPTKKCTAENRCVCGTDKDCPAKKKCNGKGGCVDCLKNEDCTESGSPTCVNSQCMQCAPGDSRACVPEGSKACTKGTQSCKGGVWSKCVDWKICGEFEKCEAEKCVPDCPATQCKEGVFACTTKPSEIPGQYKVCTKNARGCFEFGTKIKDCPRQHYCNEAKCVQAKCPKGQTDCKVDIQSDRAHCGKCGNVCLSGQVCSNNTCVVSCVKGQTNCGGSCVNIQNDRANCGKCANACKSGQVCSNAKCVVSCPSGQTNCGGSCVDVQTDRANCGVCGKVCNSGVITPHSVERHATIPVPILGRLLLPTALGSTHKIPAPNARRLVGPLVWGMRLTLVLIPTLVRKIPGRPITPLD